MPCWYQPLIRYRVLSDNELRPPSRRNTFSKACTEPSSGGLFGSRAEPDETLRRGTSGRRAEGDAGRVASQTTGKEARGIETVLDEVARARLMALTR